MTYAIPRNDDMDLFEALEKSGILVWHCPSVAYCRTLGVQDPEAEPIEGVPQSLLWRYATDRWGGGNLGRVYLLQLVNRVRKDPDGMKAHLAEWQLRQRST